MHNFKLSQSVYPLSCLKDLKTYSPAQFATRDYIGVGQAIAL